MAVAEILPVRYVTDADGKKQMFLFLLQHGRPLSNITASMS